MTTGETRLDNRGAIWYNGYEEVCLTIISVDKWLECCLGTLREPRFLADSLFIRTDLAAAYQAYAESLGRSVERLTRQERLQAALGAILEAGEEKP